MNLRRFNDHGLAKFRDYLGVLREDKAAPPPVEMIEGDDFSSPLPAAIPATPETFRNRMHFARWLHSAAEAAGQTIPREDGHFWAWMSLWLFDQVCPVNGKGQRKPNEDARYVPDFTTSRRSYRHALAGTYAILHLVANQEHAEPLLSGPLHSTNDEAYRLFVENNLVNYPSAVAALRTLYFDAENASFIRGAKSKNAGSIRRLVKLMSQYARTYDLDVISPERMLHMLPTEFDRWKQRSAVGTQLAN